MPAHAEGFRGSDWALRTGFGWVVVLVGLDLDLDVDLVIGT